MPNLPDAINMFNLLKAIENHLSTEIPGIKLEYSPATWCPTINAHEEKDMLFFDINGVIFVRPTATIMVRWLGVTKELDPSHPDFFEQLNHTVRTIAW